MDSSYEVQTEVESASGTIGGLLLFYSDKAFVGVTAGDEVITIYGEAGHHISTRNRWGRHFYLKIINRSQHCEFLISADGKNWDSFEKNVDVSALNHNVNRGFLSLRPALMSAGNGVVSFRHFVYRPN
jgi:beta-xylosidase